MDRPDDQTRLERRISLVDGRGINVAQPRESEDGRELKTHARIEPRVL